MAARRKLSGGLLVSLAATLLLALAAGLSLTALPEPQDSRASGARGFDLQGHRGARGLEPENSLPAFEAALALGVTTLELDLAISRDGVLLVHHDRRLDPERTRDAAGDWLEAAAEPPALVALPLAELQRYDIGRLRPGSRAAARFPDQQGRDGVRIPTLEAVVAQAEAASGGTIRYNLETKLSPLAPDEAPQPKAFAALLVEALQGLGIASRSSVQSFDWRSLQAVQELTPEIATVYLTAERDWLDNLERGRPGSSPWTAGFDPDDHGGSVARTVEAAGGTAWSPYFRDLRPAELAEARQLGLAVVVWTVNEPADMAALIESGVDGIITDYPDRLRRVLQQAGFRQSRSDRGYVR